jgi:hypothetical protein
MTYIAAQDSSDGVAKVIYQSKDGKPSKTFDALDWLAQSISPTRANRWFATEFIRLWWVYPPLVEVLF